MPDPRWCTNSTLPVYSYPALAGSIAACTMGMPASGLVFCTMVVRATQYYDFKNGLLKM